MRRKVIFLTAATMIAMSTMSPVNAQVRKNIRVVGSSTVFPFAKAVAERFSRTNPSASAPVIESTGTGSGFKLFCAGVGFQHPDISNASRRIKASEFAACKANGVTQITEIAIGLDGITLATGESSPKFALTQRDIYMALAAKPFGKPNTSKTWKDVNPKLPATRILFYGPPTTSGTRDSLGELIMKPGCETSSAMAAMKKADEPKYTSICTGIRTDGAYVESGENDNLIVSKLAANPGTIGILGYSYLEENPTRLNAVTINGVAPTYNTISSFQYPGARPLYIYVKGQHVKAVPGLRAFVAEFVRDGTFGPNGYLVKQGMIALPEAVRVRNQGFATTLPALGGGGLK